jgi:hypothetical protein
MTEFYEQREAADSKDDPPAIGKPLRAKDQILPLEDRASLLSILDDKQTHGLGL